MNRASVSSSNIPIGVLPPPPQYRLGSGDLNSREGSSLSTSWATAISSGVPAHHHHHRHHHHHHHHYHHHNQKYYNSISHPLFYSQQHDKSLSPTSDINLSLESPARSSKNRQQWQQQKPRSWDNLLSTRAFGGYGFGYGFIDTKAIEKGERVKSNSTYRLRDNKENISNELSTSQKGDNDSWPKEKCSTMPRQKMKSVPISSENLVSPLDSSSCFSCDCISLDPPPLDMCMFSKPKSTESLLAPRSLHPAASEISLASPEATLNRRRSRASSLADCLGGARHSPPEKDQMTHL